MVFGTYDSYPFQSRELNIVILAPILDERHLKWAVERGRRKQNHHLLLKMFSHFQTSLVVFDGHLALVAKFTVCTEVIMILLRDCNSPSLTGFAIVYLAGEFNIHIKLRSLNIPCFSPFLFVLWLKLSGSHYLYCRLWGTFLFHENIFYG